MGRYGFHRDLTADEAVAELRRRLDSVRETLRVERAERSREAEQVRRVLDELAHAAEQFMTEASYRVSGEREEQLVASIDDAQAALSNAAEESDRR